VFTCQNIPAVNGRLMIPAGPCQSRNAFLSGNRPGFFRSGLRFLKARFHVHSAAGWLWGVYPTGNPLPLDAAERRFAIFENVTCNLLSPSASSP
jgi:hypothetical protein